MNARFSRKIDVIMADRKKGIARPFRLETRKKIEEEYRNICTLVEGLIGHPCLLSTENGRMGVEREKDARV